MIVLKSVWGALLCLSIASTKVYSSEASIRYVALGDSYTIGTGALPEEAWPTVMTKRLKAEGKVIELVENLGRNGWTSEDVLKFEIPALKQLNPDFVTILIGTNDWVHGVTKEDFEQNVSSVLDQLIQLIPDLNRILVLTIPDFSVSPVGPQYSDGRDIAKGLAEFNQIILKQAKARQLKVVDLYALSEELGKDASMFAQDGLHPSAKGYAKWAELITPQVKDLLK